MTPTSGGPLVVRDAASGRVIAQGVVSGTSFWQRFMGLMGRDALAPHEGLYLPTSSIHMLFMRFSIDALFLARPDGRGARTVVGLRHRLAPWRDIVLPVRGAAGVVELPAGTLQRSGLQLGDAVVFDGLAGVATV